MMPLRRRQGGIGRLKGSTHRKKARPSSLVRRALARGTRWPPAAQRAAWKRLQDDAATKRTPAGIDTEEQVVEIVHAHR